VSLHLTEKEAERKSTGPFPPDADRTAFPVKVRLLCPDMSFRPDEDTGVVMVQRYQDSVATTLTGTVNPNASGELVVVATFEYVGRFCGATRRLLSTGLVREDKPTKNQTRVILEGDAPKPHLTVQIHSLDRGNPGRLYWMLQVAKECEGLPARLSGEVDLGSDPAAFFQSVVNGARELLPGEHYDWFLGLGQLLYQRTPHAFRETFRALRKQYGPGFPIQFITDDPYMPWELMAPTDVPGAGLLGVEHPVARWLLDYQTLLTTRLTQGEFLTVAPDYQFHPHLAPLPQAQEESRQLTKRFQAVRVVGRRKPVLDVLQGNHDTPVGLLHFAGYGRFNDETSRSSIVLEDGFIHARDVRRPIEARHPRGDGNSRPLVLFNMYEAGADTTLSGRPGEWVEAFSGHFAGVITPLWPVADAQSARVVEQLVADLREKHLTVSEALRALRERDGRTSPLYLSYVYVGDVMARFTPPGAASLERAAAG
jgi:hypothetical protein